MFSFPSLGLGWVVVIITEARVADLERVCLGLWVEGPASGEGSGGAWWRISVRSSFFAARPRTSSAITAAAFFLELSSSEEREEDIIVSRVP